jgi:hypothetical protein
MLSFYHLQYFLTVGRRAKQAYNTPNDMGLRDIKSAKKEPE